MDPIVNQENGNDSAEADRLAAEAEKLAHAQRQKSARTIADKATAVTESKAWTIGKKVMNGVAFIGGLFAFGAAVQMGQQKYAARNAAGAAPAPKAGK